MKLISSVVCAFCAAFGLAVSASAGDVTLTWDTSATPATLGDAATGLLEFVYVDGVVSNITAHPVDGGTIIMTGDQIDVCSLAEITMAGTGELVFSNAVHGSWNLNVYSSVQDYNTLSYDGANLGTDYTTIFANQNLSDWMPLKTGNVGGKGWWQADNIPTYNIRAEADGSITAQRQANSGDTVLVVKFQLKQIGANIAGRVLRAGYWYKTLGKGVLGDDFDAVIANPVTYGKFTDNGVSTPTKNSGYGICKLTMSRVKGLPTVRFAGGLNIGGVLYANEYTHVIYERAVTGSVGHGYRANANGILTFRDPTYLFDPSANAAKTAKLSDYGLQGAGTVEFEATDALYGDEGHDAPVTVYSPWLPSNDWVTVARDCRLSNLTNVTAHFDGGGMNGAHKNKLEPIQYMKDMADGRKEGQFQHKSGWSATPNQTQCVMVEFRQNGSDVQMRGKGVGMIGDASIYGTQEIPIRTDIHYTVSSSVSHYGVHDITLYFSASAIPVKFATMGYYPGIRNMAGSTTVPGCKAQLVIKGTDNTRMRYAPPNGNGHVLPYTDGLLRVLNGGDVVQQKAQNSYDPMWVGDAALIRIERGGRFLQQTYWGLGKSQRVEIIGGEFRAYNVTSAPQGQLVVNLMTFTDNASFYPMQVRSSDLVRAGYQQDAVWTVRGTSATTFTMPLMLWGAAEEAAGGNTMTFAVNDVADGSDFIMNGTIARHSTEPDVLGVYKTGSGTMELNASYNVGTTPTLLKGGTWLFNASSLASSTSPYTIDGGTLAVADGTANSVGVLTVGENGGGITLGAGATLMFADSSAAEWAGTNRVVVTGFAEKSIRIGTDADALTLEQRRRLRTSDNRRLYLDYDGFLTTTGNGTFIYIH